MTATKPHVFITGQNGMVGQQLSLKLANHYTIVPLTRMNLDPSHPEWNYTETLQRLNIKAPFAVIHLAGAGIADKRWSKAYKQTIYNSRINGTQNLVNAINAQKHQPEVFMCASAIGYYGHRPNEILDEKASSGNNFVAKISRDWERESQNIDGDSTRVINLRFGMILDKSGGALKSMLLPFKFGLGGNLGQGKQIYSWVTLHDVTAATHHLLKAKEAQGVFNVTAEKPTSNKLFTKTLASCLNRPAFMHMPAPIVRLVFGEVADELLLADADVRPTRLINSGFSFTHNNIEQAIKHVLN
jgi:uncharacterized protein (TIGR01777 family)